MRREPLDTYDMRPRAMAAYLAHNGWHFNKALCQYAVSKMKGRDGGSHEPWHKERVQQLLEQYGVRIENNSGYDAVYVCNMAVSDFYGSSITDEQRLALYVKDVVDDPDQADGFIMARWYASMSRAGERVPWEEVI